MQMQTARISALAVLSTVTVLFLSACTDREQPAAKEQVDTDHIFKTQERALEKSRGIEQTLEDAAAQQRILMERQDR